MQCCVHYWFGVEVMRLVESKHYLNIISLPLSLGQIIATTVQISFRRLCGSGSTLSPVPSTVEDSYEIAAQPRFGPNNNRLEMTTHSPLNHTLLDNHSSVVILTEINSVPKDILSGFTLREEQWVAPVMALSCLNMIVIALFEIFVIYKACRYEIHLYL